METVREVIVVEGRYDVARVKSVVNATVIETGGFGIFKDAEKKALLRTLAALRGLLILTDSDGAGLVIRNHLTGCVPADRIKQAYIPQIAGKERRKTAPPREGTLGVEGMDGAVILEALRRAGATFEGASPAPETRPRLTKADLYADGLIGRDGSARLRERLQQSLGLPKNLSANRLLEVLNLMDDGGRYRQALRQLTAAPTDPPFEQGVST